MPVRTRKDLQQSLQQGKIEPVYFSSGPKLTCVKEAADAIADEALRDTLLREFNDSSVSLTSESAPDRLPSPNTADDVFAASCAHQKSCPG